MLTPPDLTERTIIACIHDAYALDIIDVTFLPIGADINSAVYRLNTEDGTPYFLKLRSGDFDEIAVAVPAFLHAQGIDNVIAPIHTNAHNLSVRAHGFDWILYPFLVGTDGWNVPLTPAQWRALGATLKAVHTTVLPLELAARVPRETFSARLREIVRAYLHDIDQGTFEDEIAERFAALWRSRRDEIELLVIRAEQFAAQLAEHEETFAVCHTDIHAGNVMLGADDAIAIVDWDNPLLAPKERDLMFIGGGIGRYWKDERDVATFYEVYGPTDINWIALCYYRYERIVADFAAYGDQVFGVVGSAEDREEAILIVADQFESNEVIEIAHRTYERFMATQ